MLFSLTPSHNIDRLGDFKSVEFVRMDGHDFIHAAALSETLKTGISRAADAFTATFNPDGFKFVLEAIKQGRANANFVFLNFTGCDAVPAGVSITFPTVYTVYDHDKRCFKFFPAIYDEDFIVDKELSKLFKGPNSLYELPDKQSLAARFLAQQSLHAATNALNDFPNGMGAKAMIVEYGDGCNAAEGLLKKFGAVIDKSDKNIIWEFKDLSSFKKQKTQSGVYVNKLTSGVTPSGSVEIQDHLFAITTDQQSHGFVLAMTATQAITSFQGQQPKIRVSFTSDGRNGERVSSKYTNDPGSDPKFKCLIKSMMLAAANKIAPRDWITNVDGEKVKQADVIAAMNIHTLGEHQVSDALQNMGGTGRVLGDQEDTKFPMKGSVVVFDTVTIPDISDVSKMNNNNYIVISNGNGNGNGAEAKEKNQGRSAACGPNSLRYRPADAHP